MFHSKQLGKNRLTTVWPRADHRPPDAASSVFLEMSDDVNEKPTVYLLHLKHGLHQTNVYKLKTTFIQTSFSVYLCLSSSSWSPPPHLLSSLLSCSFVLTTFSSTFSSGCCELSSLFWSLLSRHDRQTKRERQTDRWERQTDKSSLWVFFWHSWSPLLPVWRTAVF